MRLYHATHSANLFSEFLVTSVEEVSRPLHLHFVSADRFCTLQFHNYQRATFDNLHSLFFTCD